MAKTRTHCKAQHGLTRNYAVEADLKTDASQTVKE